MLVRQADMPYYKSMQESKLTVRVPRELFLKLKSVLTLKDLTITKWVLQKAQEEIGKQE